jgi:hypothetical protein
VLGKLGIVGKVSCKRVIRLAHSIFNRFLNRIWKGGQV